MYEVKAKHELQKRTVEGDLGQSVMNCYEQGE